VPQLVQALKSQYAETRRGAAEELAAFGPRAHAAVPALIEALRDPDVGVRFLAVQALGDIGPEAQAAIPALLGIDQSPIPGARVVVLINYGAESALARIGPTAVPALRKALRDPNAPVRGIAARALGEIGPPARESLPDLSALVKDEEWSVRLDAAIGLWTVGRDLHAAVAVLTGFQAGQEGRDEGHYQAIEALGRILQEAAGLYSSQDLDVRKAITYLAQAVRDKDGGDRAAAVEALGRAGAPAREALTKAQRSEDPVVRFLAARALARVDPSAAAAQFALLLRDGDATVRALAADELRRLGPRAKSVVPALRRALTDSDEDVRASATEALRVIEPRAEARPSMP
jgi:HEAT repeat protein